MLWWRWPQSRSWDDGTWLKSMIDIIQISRLQLPLVLVVVVCFFSSCLFVLYSSLCLISLFFCSFLLLNFARSTVITSRGSLIAVDNSWWHQWFQPLYHWLTFSLQLPSFHWVGWLAGFSRLVLLRVSSNFIVSTTITVTPTLKNWCTDDDLTWV